jgi:hypothetical protein
MIRKNVEKFIIIALIALSGALSFSIIYEYENTQRDIAFMAKTDALFQKLEIEMDRKFRILKALNGYFLSSTLVDAEEWQIFLKESTNLSKGEHVAYAIRNNPSSAKNAQTYGISNSSPNVLIYGKNLVSQEELEELLKVKQKTGLLTHLKNNYFLTHTYEKGEEKGLFIIKMPNDSFLSNQEIPKGVNFEIKVSDQTIFNFSTGVSSSDKSIIKSFSQSSHRGLNSY